VGAVRIIEPPAPSTYLNTREARILQAFLFLFEKVVRDGRLVPVAPLEDFAVGAFTTQALDASRSRLVCADAIPLHTQTEDES
jgi:hypothetical protein